MSQPNIHPLAIIEQGAVIGPNVTVEAFAVIKKNVELEEGVVVKSHAYVDGHTIVGSGTHIYPGTSIGTNPQSPKFRGEKSFIRIGKNCEIREYCTINSSLLENSVVTIGDGCILMAYTHIAHNCSLGNYVIMANNATLAGHVTVEDHAIIGGMTPVHQFSRIGCYAMVGGLSRVNRDVPPYTIGAGIPYKLGGLNLVGLKRHGFPLEVRKELSKAFRLVYRSQLRLEEALDRVEKEIPQIPEVVNFVNFCRASRRGLIALQGVTHLSEQDFLEFDTDTSDLCEVGASSPF